VWLALVAAPAAGAHPHTVQPGETRWWISWVNGRLDPSSLTPITVRPAPAMVPRNPAGSGTWRARIARFEWARAAVPRWSHFLHASITGWLEALLGFRSRTTRQRGFSA